MAEVLCKLGVVVGAIAPTVANAAQSVSGLDGWISSAASVGGVGVLLIVIHYLHTLLRNKDEQIDELIDELKEVNDKCKRCELVKASNKAFIKGKIKE